jgi:hypothetical protein
MAEAQSTARRPAFRIWPIVLIVAITLLADGPVLRNGFVNWDDYTFIASSPLFNPPSIGNLARCWVPDKRYDLYVPVTFSTWMVLSWMTYQPPADARVTPDAFHPAVEPAAFHAASLLVHAWAAVAVFLLIRRVLAMRMSATRVVLPSLFGAALFAAHPVQVETVAWAAGLKDTLGGALTATTLLLYLHYIDSTSRRQLAWGLATMAFVLAMLSKPSAVTIPISALAADRLLMGRSWKTALISIAPWIALAVPVVAVNRWAQPMPPFVTPVFQRPLIAGDALAWDLRRIIVPSGFAVDYARAPDIAMQGRWIAITWIIPVVIGGIVVAIGRRLPWLATAAVWFVTPLLPVLGFVPFVFQQYSTVADHYLYPAMIGVALAVAGALAAIPSGSALYLRRVAFVAAAAGIVCLALLSRQQSRIWKDTVTLFRHNLDVAPGSFESHRVLGYVASHQDPPDWPTAEREYLAALAIRPGNPLAQNNLRYVRQHLRE